MSKKNRSADRAKQTSGIVAGIIGLVIFLSLCMMAFLAGGKWTVDQVSNVFQGDSGTAGAPATAWAPDSAELTVAVSPVMAPVLAELAEAFNRQALQTPDGQAMTVRVLPLEPEKMVAEAARQPVFQAISPDSSLWLDRLEQRWASAAAAAGGDGEAQIPIGQRRIAEQARYAVSPIVIAAWESAARELGWPARPVGWQDIQRQATQNPNFKWNHPSTNNAAGLLATLAEFYAGAGLTRGLTAEAATAQSTLDYVKAVEATVRFYGEGEDVIVQRLAAEGRSFLDAFVAQERVVVDWNKTPGRERLVAIYPAEGTLWTDHPLALLELDAAAGETPVTDNQRRVYQALASFLTGPEAQQRLLDAGYRPADLGIALDAAGSPFAGTDAVDWRQPQTTLQMPSPAVVDVVQNFWYYAKRPTNVILVVDTSGSMEGEKIERARAALQAFVGQIRGERDRISLVEFASDVKSFVPLQTLDDANRQALLTRIGNLEAGGGTALLDATYAAADYLLDEATPEAINAIVVMTDGQENESRSTFADIQRLLGGGETPPVIFTIGFGGDADEAVLGALAAIGGGQFRRASETDIEELYKLISTYF